MAAGIPIVDKLLGVLEKALENSNLRIEQRPIERVREKKLEILNERAKGDSADQQKIASLYQELEVEVDALDSAVAAGIAKKQ